MCFSPLQAAGKSSSNAKNTRRNLRTSSQAYAARLDYYKILGVDKDADVKDIKKAYREGAMKYHPDRNQDPKAAEEFKKISEAYAVLSNEEKRKVYDQYGAEAVDSMGQGNPFGGPFGGQAAEDIFHEFMQNMGGMPNMGGRRRQRPLRTPDVEHVITAELEDFYQGKTVKLDFHRRTVCTGCNGTGAKPPAKATTCTTCRGSGQRIQLRQMGPAMVQQMISECDTCQGTGEYVNPKHRYDHMPPDKNPLFESCI
jgi:DnaJ-class molecular chaperone